MVIKWLECGYEQATEITAHLEKHLGKNDIFVRLCGISSNAHQEWLICSMM